MAKLVIDIETIGHKIKDFDSISKEYFSKWATEDPTNENDDLQKVEEKFALSPLTGQVFCIGILNPDTNKGAVYYQNPDNPAKTFEEHGIKFEAMTEKEMLQKFWQDALSYDEFITFNGRGFDIPFLIIRSAVHKVKPTKNLMSNRYLFSQFKNAKHIDLYDQLKFYGAVFSKGNNLHMYCQAFGIPSPKSKEASGDQVQEMYQAKRFDDIAKYNVNDIVATAQLYKVWDEYINI